MSEISDNRPLRSPAHFAYLRDGCSFLPVRICSAVGSVEDWRRGFQLSGINLGYVSTSVASKSVSREAYGVLRAFFSHGRSGNDDRF